MARTPKLPIPRLRGGENPQLTALRADLERAESRLRRVTLERDEARAQRNELQSAVASEADTPPCPNYAAMGVDDPAVLAALTHLWAVTHARD